MEEIKRKGPVFTKDTREFKVKKLIEYFVDKNRIDVTDKNFESAIKLDKMIFLYNEQTDLLNKYFNMKMLFKTPEDFYREYRVLEEYRDVNTVKYLYDYVLEIAGFLTNIEKSLSKETKKELLELEKDRCFDDYPYAKYFVKEYIEYKDSPYLKDFLKEKGIYEPDFKRFISILIRIDDELYEQYLEKEKENKLSRQFDVMRKIENIRSGVVTGFTTDGVKFDEVEYYSNLPFFDQDTSRAIIEDFGFKKMATVDQRLRTLFENLSKDDLTEIMNYIYSNKLMFGHIVSMVNEKDILKNRYIIKEKELTKEDKEIILEYMRERNIPFLSSAFNAVKNKYVDGELKLLKEEKTLKK